MNERRDLHATRTIAEALESLGVRYHVGGSMASSAHGVPRSTVDADLIADLKLSHADALYERLHRTFYVEREAIHSAVMNRTSFNVVQRDSSFKVDIFPLKREPFELACFERAAPGHLMGVTDRTFPLARPEDVILHKLTWYRDGGEVSERQWGDVIGVLRIQEGALDNAHLDYWAAELKVADLLERARREARWE